jgi:trimethylamine corrinoid protein
MSDKLVDALADIREDEAMAIAQEYLDQGLDPVQLLEFARQAMDLVGKRFAEGEYFLPELVMAGEMLNSITEWSSPSWRARAPRSRNGARCSSAR